MACASCGAENPAGNRFCGACGAALARTCDACGSRNPPTNRFCGECGAYRLAGPVDTIRVPATVQVVLSARIDRLPPEDKRLLQTAAVIGKDLPFVLLQRIAETPTPSSRPGSRASRRPSCCTPSASSPSWS